MANTRTVDFLPEIFQTPANKQFLSATLDQLVQEPRFKRTQGFIGQRVGPGVNPNDSYVVELDQSRANYQLEPGVVQLNADRTSVLDAITYPGVNDALAIQGAPVNNSSRLYIGDYYTWDPFVDFDKFVNFSQYYWVPNGPDAVDVFQGGVPTTNTFDVALRSNRYSINGFAGNNPPLTLVRGGSYTFDVNQPGGFWIQQEPGTSGTLAATPNISSRQIVGVNNNGATSGTVTFDVPSKDTQAFFFDLPDAGVVDLVTDLKFNQINNIFVSEFLRIHGSIDGINNLDGRTVILTNRAVNPEDGGWLATTQFDPLIQVSTNNGLAGSYDSLPYDSETIVPADDRYSIWRIQYVANNDGTQYIQLVQPQSVSNISKVSVQFGTQWSNTQWWKDSSGFWNVVPNLTTLFDTLYYQNGLDPLAFGVIQLIDQDQIDSLDVNDILGKQVYTSSNGVVFTNNLKVVFRGEVEPTLYQNNEYYVAGVGSAIKLLPISDYVVPEAYATNNVGTATNFPDVVAKTFIVTAVPNPDGAGAIYAVDGVNKPVLNFVRGGVYTFDQSDVSNINHPLRIRDSEDNSWTVGVVATGTPGNAGAQTVFTVPNTAPNDLRYYCTVHGNGMGNIISVVSSNFLAQPDYITINLDSQNLNAWSRSNRWFHIDVITAAATYNNTDIVIDNAFRAKRPILEYRGGIRLFNMGTSAKQPVDIIDFSIDDALSNVNGAAGLTIDGYALVNGSRVIFAADTDPEVRNKIYSVELILPDSASTVPIINLTATDDALVLPDQSVVILNGVAQKGVSYYYTGIDWIRAQQKTARNQAPLFDVYDLDNISFGNAVKYPSTSFAGSKLFGYAVGTSAADSVLGFPLQYLSLTNVGDIVFDNNFYTDTFSYVKDNVGTTENISNGIVREYQDRIDFVVDIGWQPAVTKSKIYQQFTFLFENLQPLILDVPIVADDVVPGVKIYVDGKFQIPGSYSVEINSNSTIINLINADLIPTGTDIVVLALSNSVSQVGFYQVPNNLENNPLNENAAKYTLGTARSHYQTIAENLPNLQGLVNGANNIRDLGNVIPYGLKILQQSAPMTLAGYFLRSSQYNIFSSLEFNSREYEKLKAQILSTAVSNDYTNMTASSILDSVLEELSQGKSEMNSFYWSDMMPSGSVYTETRSTFTSISVPVFDTVQIYNFASANYLGLLVYVNNQLLLRGSEYVVATDGPRLTIIKPLLPGDIIVIREYSSTVGSFVPNTPTKMGLYPAYRPSIYLDTTYINPVTVIRGHDGSITVGFGDFRDELLLEFERRIYSNIKLDNNPIPLLAADVVSGQFRITDYSLNEINEILGKDFLGWVGWNKLDYKTQDYLPLDNFTYNYSAAGNRLSNNQPLAVGAWRGLYNYFYDTTHPNTRPWEMLGFSEQPIWWENYYGISPYTSGNLVLWDDLEAGLVRDPAGEYIVEKYRRPGLTSVIPSGSEGELLSPLETVVSNYSSTDFRKSWTVGDDGPTENAWKTSSSYPFAVMRLLALTRPAEFFSVFADRDLYQFDGTVGQYLYNRRYRLNANGIEVYGNGKSKASFVNWIVDYNRQTGLDSTDMLSVNLKSLDVRLCYRMAGFSAKNLLQVYTEKSSPDSANSGLLLPDESYNLLLYKNVPFDTLTYSGVIIQKTDLGFALWGYSALTPYFNILQSRSAGRPVTITGGGVSVQVSTAHTDRVVSVPYGYVFSTAAGVADFLISYGALLQRQGMIFNDVENGYVLNWQQMVTEFLYWTSQAWGTGSLINLNPNATKLVIDRPLSIVDNISLQTQENLVLDQDRKQLTTRDLIIDRQDNRFSIETTNQQTISYINLKFVNYEHMIVLDNRSIFADLIYDPVTDARQSRIKLSGSISTDWNGQVNAPGFILNQANIEEWHPFRKYAKGSLVFYKNHYYSALGLVEPSDRFNFSQWARSNFTQIQQGLLPNLANKSDQLANTYSVNSANLERDQDIFSYGLIGFKPREYMTALNLDDVSQVNLYKQFLGTKGTLPAAELFKFADIGRGATEFDIYENWALQRATYGANANRSYYELQLNEAVLQSNPCLIQVISSEQVSRADQTVLLDNIWKQSYKITNTNILNTTTESITDTALPTAGYVNIDDINLTMFDLGDPTALNQFIDEIGIDTRIWVAKTNAYDWGVFRCYGIPGNITVINSNLDGTSTVTFSRQHNLAVGNTVIIKFFNNDVDGVYQVLATPTTQSVVVAYEFLNQDQITLVGNGVGLGLETLRVAQGSDAVTLPESNRLVPGSRIWVDNNGENLWQVLEKQDVFTAREQLVPDAPIADSRYGSSAAQSQQNLFAVVGNPAYSESGAVIFYIRNNLGNYQQTDIQELLTTGTRSFGFSVAIGNQNWIAVGSPDSQWEPLDSTLFEQVGAVAVINRQDGSGQFVLSQLLTPPALDLDRACEFGFSVAVSQDQRWLYIGAPGINRVYAYSLVEVENQSVQYTTTENITYNYTDSIIVNDSDSVAAASQLVVVLDNELITNFSANVDTGNVELGFTPVAGQTLTITRRTAVIYQGDGSTTNYDIADALFTVGNIDAFSVFVDGVIQRPKIDYVFNAGVLIFVDTEDSNIPGPSDIIEIRANSYYQFVDEIAPSDSINSNARFGASITCTTDGRQVMIGADKTNVGSATGTGAVYVYDRTVQRFIVPESGQTSYQVSNSTLTAPTSVTLNNQFLTNTDGNISGEFSVSGNTIEFELAPAVGDEIIIDVNTFNFVQKVVAEQPSDYQLFGFAIDICSNDCSLYIGAPGLVSELPQSGAVQRSINQSRVYGIIGSLTPNPEINVGDSVRINDINVIVPANSDSSQPTVSDLARAINSTGIPNVVASVTADLTFVGTGLEQEFYIGSIYSTAAESAVLVDDVLQTLDVDYTYNSMTETVMFTTPPSFNAVITVVTGRLILAAKNRNLRNDQNQLTVLPGVDSTLLWQRLGFVTYAFTQSIVSPAPAVNAQFGSSVAIDSSARTLVVGAPGANAFAETTIDNGSTLFDAKTTTFSTTLLQSGVVYTFDLLNAADFELSNPDNFIFGQQIFDSRSQIGDQFGTAVSYVNQVLLVTVPGHTAVTDTESVPNSGKINLYINQENLSAWVPIRQQPPVVNINLINSVFVYDVVTGAKTEFFDFIDPLQGKILGAAKQNIDFIGAVDPGAYNVGSINNYGKSWGDQHVGQIWWDTNNTRFIDPNQNDIVYASRRWGQLFPGSTVEVYQWIVSNVPPADYVGDSVPRSIESYSIVNAVDVTGVRKTKYYFWVRGARSIASDAGKTLSTDAIGRYIENPRASGIPYVAFINASTTALYNALSFISAQDTILSIEFDRTFTDNAVHVEYELIPENRSDGFLSKTLYRKFQDSMCGADTAGNLVPDVNLRPANRYGVDFRPRQSMFANRFVALDNYLSRVNSVLAQFPISETRSFELLNSQDPEPTSMSGDWSKRVANIEELSYQNLLIVPTGYRYLVESDSTQNGLWTIYQVTAAKTFATLQLVRVQTFKTNKYWSYIDWYQVGYNSSTRPILEVDNVGDLATISVPLGSTVRVRANSQGKFEIYQLSEIGWSRVGLEDGTIKFSAQLWNYQLGRFGFDVEVFDSQYFDQAPVTETRKIIQAVNQELLIDELAIERNRAMILVFNFILSEQIAPEWITKTSLVDVDHKIRQLLPFQTFNRDNQEFVIDYIQEVKPYHVQVREFNLIYEGFDVYRGTLTDFDVPAYWKTDLAVPQFVSPVLTPYSLSTATGTGRAITISDAGPADTIWQTEPWAFWYKNYALSVESVTMINGGSGYTVPPTVTLQGDATEPAQLTATINSAGQVTAVTVVSPGSGYLLTPTVVIAGAGTGAQAYAVMGNNLIRNIKTTIKYDRYQYQADIVDWQPNVSYDNGTLVKFDDRVWSADSDDSGPVESTVFELAQWNLVPAGELSAADRTQGYYNPRPNMPGLDLPLLIDGIDYPGVQVTGPLFSQNTGFDVGNFDINPFDNIAFGPEGRPTYSPSILDAIYESNFLDSFLGTQFTDVNIDGGAFVDTYSSHAPQELVPGSEFDTLDFKVFTTPGADWTGDGHGWPTQSTNFVFRAELPFEQLFAIIQQSLVLVNTRTQQPLFFGVDYTIDFDARTVTFFQPSVEIGDFVQTTVFAIGTANVIFSGVFLYPGPATPLPAPPQLIDQLVNFVNATGVSIASFAGLVEVPIVIKVTNQTRRVSLVDGIDYAVNWPDQTVTVFTTDAVVGDVIQLTVYGIGGGNQLFKQSYNGTEIGRSVFIPVTFGLITQTVVFVNGVFEENYGIFSENSGTLLQFDRTLGINDFVTITLISDSPIIIPTIEPFDSGPFDSGDNSSAPGSFDFSGLAATGSVLDFSWSSPVTELYVAETHNSTTFTLTNSFLGTNQAVAIVEKNGIRATPPAGVEYVADGSLAYELPNRIGVSQEEIQDQDVLVWVNNQLQALGTDYVIESYTVDDIREVIFNVAPESDSQILIFVTTQANYIITPGLSTSTLQWRNGLGFDLVGGDIISVTSWNATDQQNILNKVFVGPVTQGLTLVEGFDSTDFDEGTVTGTAGTFDYSEGIEITVNNFDLGRNIKNSSRLWVTLDGRRLFVGSDFTIDQQELVLASGPILNSQTLAVTMFTDNIVPDAMAFRIFNDMRGVAATYRITVGTTTKLTKELLPTDDVIHVRSSQALAVPDLSNNIWGILTVNGERILYRQLDIGTNTVSGLLRGTAGTAIAAHTVESIVYNMSRINLAPTEYQNKLVSSTYLANGVDTEFATNIELGEYGVDFVLEAVEVYVGGSLQPRTSYYLLETAPVTVMFDDAPQSGLEVVIVVRQGLSWYQPGTTTASDGLPLQETDTVAARFFRGSY